MSFVNVHSIFKDKRELSLGYTSLELPTMFLCIEMYASPRADIVGVLDRFFVGHFKRISNHLEVESNLMR